MPSSRFSPPIVVAIALLGIVLLLVKIWFETIPVAAEVDENFSSGEILTAASAILAFSNEMSSWALAAMGGSGAIAFSRKFTSTRFQIFFLFLSFGLLISSLLFSTIINDIYIRALVIEYPDLIWNQINTAIRFQYILLYGGILTLVINLATLVRS
ncbi:MAG: hypothetical protein RIB97_22105 [Nitratireductor sp.]|jgi:hypothetical protein